MVKEKNIKMNDPNGHSTHTHTEKSQCDTENIQYNDKKIPNFLHSTFGNIMIIIIIINKNQWMCYPSILML